jgi:hypothetical protein
VINNKIPINISNYLEKSCICGVKVQDELRSIQNKLVLNGISFKKGIEKKVFWSKNASKEAIEIQKV